MTQPLSAPVDLLIRAGAIYSMASDRAIYRSIALRNDRIVALSSTPDGLGKLISSEARIADDSSLTLLPAFIDTHNHLLEATRNRTLVPVQTAHSLAHFLELIRIRAMETPKGRWIQTSNAWHEQNLDEKRLPNALELDQATSDHPVLLRRGGHMAVANSPALKLAGLSETTPDPPGGRLGRFPDGELDGVLEGGAQYQFIHIPPLPQEEQVAALEQSCRMFSAADGGGGTIIATAEVSTPSERSPRTRLSAGGDPPTSTARQIGKRTSASAANGASPFALQMVTSTAVAASSPRLMRRARSS